MSYADDSYRKIKLLESERDRLKAELEEEMRANERLLKTKAFADKLAIDNLHLINDRDAWKSQCERLTEALGIASRAESLIKSIDKELCMDCGIWKSKCEALEHEMWNDKRKWSEEKSKATKLAEALRRLSKATPSTNVKECREIIERIVRIAKDALAELGDPK